MTKIYKKGIKVKMNKNETTLKKPKGSKTIKVDEDIHNKLKIYTATNKFRTIGDSIRDLLEKEFTKR